MPHSAHLLLALAALTMIGVVTVQDLLYPPFEKATISTGLNGPNHLWLDGAFLFMAIAICLAAGSGWLLAAGIVTAIGLVTAAVSNTAWRWVDGLMGYARGHEKVHIIATAVTFIGAFTYEGIADYHAGSDILNAISGLGLALPIGAYGLTRPRVDVTEKVAVLMLCVWFITWGA